MKKPYSFSNEQMNGIVEETYANIIKECENLKNNTKCPNEQVVALLSVIASNFATTEKSETILCGNNTIFIRQFIYFFEFISKNKNN